MHTHTYTHTHTHTDAHTRGCTHTDAHTRMHTFTFTFTFTRARMHRQTDRRTCIACKQQGDERCACAFLRLLDQQLAVTKHMVNGNAPVHNAIARAVIELVRGGAKRRRDLLHGVEEIITRDLDVGQLLGLDLHRVFKLDAAVACKGRGAAANARNLSTAKVLGDLCRAVGGGGRGDRRKGK